MKELKIAYVLDSNRLVLNAGSSDGIPKNQRFLVYGTSEEEIVDPVTNKPLGFLEIVRGTGKISYVQDTMSIIETDMLKSPLYSVARSLSVNPEYKPFCEPQVGDSVREISS